MKVIYIKGINYDQLKGQIIKFHTPWQMKIQNHQLYVVLEVMEDDERPRADIQALNTGPSFPPINTVRLEFRSSRSRNYDLIGHKVTIINPIIPSGRKSN
jgi:hypothetical protein